jgi:NAD(P)-dependent dehydrogenase (short-subunit alcohol dehydrogenase family)
MQGDAIMEKRTERLYNKKTVIFGAAGGIGACVSRLFHQHGALLILSDINVGVGEQLAEQLSPGSKVTFFPADICNPDDLQKLSDYITDRWGEVDVVVNCAGISGRPLGDGPVTQCSVETWNKVIEVNLTGAYHLSRYMLPFMIKANQGSLIHLVSDDALALPAPPHDTHAYIAAKGGLIALTKAMAISYAPYNIRVNAIAPGWTETPMTQDLQEDKVGYEQLKSLHPLKRIGQPEDIAWAALFLASDESGFITGHILPVEGGHTVW